MRADQDQYDKAVLQHLREVSRKLSRARNSIRIEKDAARELFLQCFEDDVRRKLAVRTAVADEDVKS